MRKLRNYPFLSIIILIQRLPQFLSFQTLLEVQRVAPQGRFTAFWDFLDGLFALSYRSGYLRCLSGTIMALLLLFLSAFALLNTTKSWVCINQWSLMIIDDVVVDDVATTTKLGAIWCSAGGVEYYKRLTKTRIIRIIAKIFNKRKSNYLSWIERELCLIIVILNLFYF